MTHDTARTKILDIISATEARTLPGLLKRRIERTPNLCAYQQYDNNRNKWISYCWQEIGNYVAQWQQGLTKESLAAGDRVAILLANSIEWVCFEQAALALGLVVVPLYTWDSPDNIAYLLKDSGSRLLLTGTAKQWLKLVPHAASFPDLDKVICLEKQDLENSTGVATVSITRWLPGDEAEMIIHVSDPDSLATIVYT